MEPVIIIEDGSSDVQLSAVINALSSNGASDITLYGAAPGSVSLHTISIIEKDDDTLGDAIRKIIGNRKRITVVGSPASIDVAGLPVLIDLIEKSGMGLVGYQGSSNAFRLDLSELTLENLVGTLSGASINIPQILSVPASLITSLPEEQITFPSLAACLSIEALSAGEEIRIVEARALLPESMHDEVSKNEISTLVRFAISQCNIEDMFPNHAWDEHEQESLSSCYHTLAGILIRLGDFETALECLSISEQFEDSPRSLALRALVACNQGRTLEAVANLVSSLQQYEERKRNNGAHYLTFTPKDYEQINCDLKDGLEALNRRDNERAFQCFSKAVFNFDNFYREIGIEAAMRVN